MATARPRSENKFGEATDSLHCSYSREARSNERWQDIDKEATGPWGCAEGLGFMLSKLGRHGRVLSRE